MEVPVLPENSNNPHSNPPPARTPPSRTLPRETSIRGEVKGPGWKLGEEGQMAIFIALIFQVLFVFFAMLVNVGLVVHDKIALQNSVDLGAYYGAMKQAEILNQMAHVNYQIRQINKLLTFRMRVVGDFGLNPPGNPGGAHPVIQGTPNGDSLYSVRGSDDTANFCVTHDAFLESNQTDRNSTLCNDINFRVNNLPSVRVVAGFLPFVSRIASLVRTLQGSFRRRCQNAGPINWNFATRLLAAYRLDLSVRKRMIRALATNLTQSEENFLDKLGGDVASGVRKTILKNMNVGDVGFRNIQVEFLNGLAQGNCGSPTALLSDVLILPTVQYSDFIDGETSCSREIKSVALLPRHGANFPDKVTPELQAHAQGEPFEPINRSSFGFEKNPWCMAWVGVKATMSSRKPFLPLGEAIQMRARAFAKPFGGRMGPWYYRSWPRSSNRSVGDPSSQVDFLAPPRANASGGGTVAPINYARYPGDRLGYRSARALSSWAQSFRRVVLGRSSLSYQWWEHLANPGQYEAVGESLAISSGHPMRRFEAAAVAPDLFDITYYSIEPRYWANYLQYQISNANAFQGVRPMADLGARTDNTEAIRFHIEDQLLAATEFQDQNLAFWKLKNIDHVLTSWAQRRAVDYSFPDQRFGHCFSKSTEARPTSGNCISGGRTGYSVKIVSRQYLKWNGHRLGGLDSSQGPIKNPPPDDF